MDSQLLNWRNIWLTVGLSLQVVLLHAVHCELMCRLGRERWHQDQYRGNKNNEGKGKRRFKHVIKYFTRLFKHCGDCIERRDKDKIFFSTVTALKNWQPGTRFSNRSYWHIFLIRQTAGRLVTLDWDENTFITTALLENRVIHSNMYQKYVFFLCKILI